MSDCEAEHEHDECESCGRCQVDGFDCSEDCRCETCVERAASDAQAATECGG